MWDKSAWTHKRGEWEKTGGVLERADDQPGVLAVGHLHLVGVGELQRLTLPEPQDVWRSIESSAALQDALQIHRLPQRRGHVPGALDEVQP